MLGHTAPQGPLFGGNTLNATDCAVAPKLYHVLVALKHYKASGLNCMDITAKESTCCQRVDIDVARVCWVPLSVATALVSRALRWGHAVGACCRAGLPLPT